MPRGVTDKAIMSARGRMAAASAYKNKKMYAEAERELHRAQAIRNRRRAQELLDEADALEASAGPVPA